MRFVLDTVVMVAAIRSSTGASRRLLASGLRRQCALLVSVPLMFEYEAVMTRYEHLAASGLAEAEIGILLDAVAAVSVPVRLAFTWRPALPDPNDDMVLETAVNGQADRLVTFNRRDFFLVGKQFGIVACSPAEALLQLESR